MRFTNGEKVLFMHEEGSGTIKEKTSSGYLVEDEFGFSKEYKPSELVAIHGADYKINEAQVVAVNEDETFAHGKHTVRKGQLTGKRKEVDVWEIDLHIEEIVNSHRGLTNGEILQKQITELKSFYNRALRKHVRKLVIIHGVGEGVLKEEVRQFLDSKEGIEVYDADFREYGKGATAVEIRYNLL